MTKALVFKDFWDIAVRRYDTTVEAAEWAHDWCEDYDIQRFWGGTPSPLLKEFRDSLEQDIADGYNDRLTRLVLDLIQEVL